jgi:hypothetical protein
MKQLDLKKERTNLKLKQKDIVSYLQSKGYKCDKYLYSKIENGLLDNITKIVSEVENLLINSNSLDSKENIKNERLQLLYSLLPHGSLNAIRGDVLAIRAKVDRRELRFMIADLREYVPVINMQNGKGYFIPDINDPEDLALLDRWIRQEESRKKKVDRSIKYAKKYKNKLIQMR